MSGNQRSRTEVIISVLETVGKKPSSKTQIMHEAGLSNYELEEYLEFILPMELIAYSETTQRYRLTEKGLHYLQTYYKTKHSVGAYTSPREKKRAYM